MGAGLLALVLLLFYYSKASCQEKIVVTLGGNAGLSSDPSTQAQQNFVETAKQSKLIKNG